MQADTLIPYGKEGPDFALMGRVGNVLLVNGEPAYSLRVHRGEVVRFHLTNAASSRTFNLSFGGAPIKLLASDVSRFEREVDGAERGDGAGGALRGRGEVRPAGTLSAASTRSRRSITSAASSRPRWIRSASSPWTRRRPPRITGRTSRRFAPTPPYRRTSSAIGPYFDKPPDKRLTLTRAHGWAAARDGAVHDDRHRVLRPGRVGGRDAGHELALDLEPGALDSPGRRDRQGERGDRLARRSGARS